LRSINTFWWIPAVSAFCLAIVFSGLVFFIRYRLEPQTQTVLLRIIEDNLGCIAAAILLALGILIWGLIAIFRWYVEPTRKIAEEMTIIHSANPSFRIDISAVKNMNRLASLVNESADRYQSLKSDIDDQIRQAREAVEEERDILSSIISGFSEAIIVCNPSGMILLFNEKTKELLGHPETIGTATFPPASIGIGRNICRYIKSSQLQRAFTELTEKISQAEDNPGTCFATLGPAGHFLKVEIVPIIGNLNDLLGYILRINTVVQRSRSSTPPPQPPVDLALSPIQLQKVLETVQKKVMEKHDLTLQLTMPHQPAWIYADKRHLTAALSFLASRLRQVNDSSVLECIAGIEQDLVHLDIIWDGVPLAEDLMAEWNDLNVPLKNGSGALTLSDILIWHEAEWWSSKHLPLPGKSCLRIFIPSAEPPKERAIAPVTLPTGRPEFYDFELFNRPDSSPDLQEHMLSQLKYTVIDTETTGLDPFSDEIIAIGAVRIVNGHLLRNETFDVLVDPQREIPENSIKFHGIREEMLQGRPTIEKILPRLFQFVGNTVLVGHNVAFDMRMFQVKEYIAPVRFLQPVLDIMFLSAVIHPSQRCHSLEAISARLGITIAGRHTALGDACAAAEILLKFIPILARSNILTLKDAIQASKKTKYAKLSY